MLRNQQDSVESPVPRVIALESDSPAFAADLETLDRISPRTADTLHVFYVRSGQKSPEDILQNVV
jgi:hypothetical protein